MGVDNVNILKNDVELIRDMAGYIPKQQRQGKTKKDVGSPLRDIGYDTFSIQALILKYWKFEGDPEE